MLVGKSGVDKSTLINEVLKLRRGEQAEEGIGRFVTTKYHPYYSDSIPFLRLVDTRGIELNRNYGPINVQNDAEKFIQEQRNTNDHNNLVQCIWYCLTGDRFEDSEIQLLNYLRAAYGDSRIPIILIYTQATDENLINGMKYYIQQKNIDAKFIEVLARGKRLINNSGYIKPFGLDVLIKETVKKCKSALKGELFSVITESISVKIYKNLVEQNYLYKNYIIREMKIFFIENFGFFKNKDIFINFVITLLGHNVNIFFEKDGIWLSNDCQNILLNSSFIKHYLENLIQQYERIAKNFVQPILESKAKEFMDLQIKVQRDCERGINYYNLRMFDEFKKTTEQFLLDNLYNIAQKIIINYIFENICENITDKFVLLLNRLITQLLQNEDSKEKIKDCFMKKYNDFEQRLRHYNFSFNN